MVTKKLLLMKRKYKIINLLTISVCVNYIIAELLCFNHAINQKLCVSRYIKW